MTTPAAADFVDEAALVDRVLQTTGMAPEALIPILQGIQAGCGYLPDAALRQVADRTGIAPATIEGVATFYPRFRRRPAGRHTIRVCFGTACHVKGAELVHEAFRRRLELADGEDTDRDRLFTVEKVACLGCCMLAPAVQIDDVIYGRVEPREADRVLRDFLSSRERAAPPPGHRPARGPVQGELRLCVCSSCCASGADAVFAAFERAIRARRIPARIHDVGCTGRSHDAPLLDVVVRGGTSFRYARVRPDDAEVILAEHFPGGGWTGRAGMAALRLLDRLVEPDAEEPITRYPAHVRDTPAAVPDDARQVRIATEHAGELDPLSLDAYLAAGGFGALRRAVAQGADWVLEEMARSGLRGRGGAGYSTALKWRGVRAAPGSVKYAICNGDEGDPGAFMDRMLLESFPFRVIEGMAIAASVVGAAEGIIYVRSEYPLALRRVRDALRQLGERGLLGADALGPGRPFHVRLAEGAGAFVCGEETALLASLEGRRGSPRFRPPYPAEHGLWGCPTLINNVETFSVVPWIIRHGGEAFAAYGSGASRGTKTFALAGKILAGGLVEAPMGASLRTIVNDLGGGPREGRTIKAVQIGGPSGGCLPAGLLDTAIEYEALTAHGAMMGSGGLVVLDDTDCMVDIARFFLEFTQAESCGKCTCCRVGTHRMHEILQRLCEGQARRHDLETLEQLAQTVARGSLCGLGKTAPNPVLSALRYFREEFAAHAAGRCPARKCRALIRYRITEDCIGCTRCAQRCPVDAIPLTPYERHVIDESRCIRCDTCRQACPVQAVVVEDRAATP